MAKTRHPHKFVGRKDRNGKPLEWFAGIPARDLDQQTVDALDDDAYETVLASSLYEQVAAPKADAKQASDKPATKEKVG